VDDDGNNIIGGAVGGRWEMEFVATAAGRGDGDHGHGMVEVVSFSGTIRRT
jgi:hypothetical protein